MQLFSRTFVVALLAVTASLVGLFVYSGALIPLLGEPVGDSSPVSTPVAIRTPAMPTAPPTPVSQLRLDAARSRPIDPGRGFHLLENAAMLEQRRPQAAHTISSLSWIEDGVVEEEREAAEALIYLAATAEKVFDSLAGKSWLNTGDLRHAGPAIFHLEYLAYRDAETASKLVEMPFLNTLEPLDALAVESLSNMAYEDIHSFKRAFRHPSISDGITDEEAPIVALLSKEYVAHPLLLNALLDPSVAVVEERVVSLPLTGSITLAIVRTGAGSSRSMELLENAVRATESLMGEPFPDVYVPLLFTEAVPVPFSGSHNGSHLAILPIYDTDNGSPEALQAGMVIAHEVAHYYWRWSQPWLDEGAAEFTATYLEHFRRGLPLEPANYPCEHTQTIRRLQYRSTGTTGAGDVCNYAVGERFFLDLYHRLGEKTFLAGFRALYREVEGSDKSQVGGMGIDQVRKAFAPSATEVPASSGRVLEEVIQRWYAGPEPQHISQPDSRPVVAELPTVNGWIERAYISLTEDGPPAKTFSVSEMGDWAWLTLEYSHDYAGAPQELVFEVVEYFEDGFPYRTDYLAIEADRRFSGGVQWLSVGPGPEQAWALGRHWIYVNHEGRKVAQVEFEVTP